MAKPKRQGTFRRDVMQLSADDTKPAPPLDPIPEFAPKPPKKDDDPLERFEAMIDPDFGLSERALTRIERQMRQAVLAEIAVLDSLPEFRVAGSSRRGVRRLEVTLVRE